MITGPEQIAGIAFDLVGEDDELDDEEADAEADAYPYDRESAFESSDFLDNPFRAVKTI
jgi:hypothetical protein